MFSPSPCPRQHLLVSPPWMSRSHDSISSLVEHDFPCSSVRAIACTKTPHHLQIAFTLPLAFIYAFHVSPRQKSHLLEPVDKTQGEHLIRHRYLKDEGRGKGLVPPRHSGFADGKLSSSSNSRFNISPSDPSQGTAAARRNGAGANEHFGWIGGKGAVFVNFAASVLKVKQDFWHWSAL